MRALETEPLLRACEKRLAGADEKIRQSAQAEFQKAADIQAVAKAEAQVECLRAQSAQPPPNPSPTPMQGVPVSMEAEVERLRAQVAQVARRSSGHCETPGRWEWS